MRRGLVPLIVTAAIGCLPLVRGGAQGVVISGTSSAQYIELRPLVVDSVPYATTDSAWGHYRRAADGTLARCDALQRFCSFFRSTTPNARDTGRAGRSQAGPPAPERWQFDTVAPCTSLLALHTHTRFIVLCFQAYTERVTTTGFQPDRVCDWERSTSDCL